VKKGCRFQAGILTGQSDPSNCALSPIQQAFLDAVAPRSAQIDRNFPYSDQHRTYKATSLLKASLRNGYGYYVSRRESFQSRFAVAVRAIIGRCDTTVFLAGSCGLELFNNLKLTPRELRRISVFAYGPVARRRPLCNHVLVAGHSDALSRWFFPHPDFSVRCSHLEYLTNFEVLALCREFIREATS
jgi:hypothetical protein